MEISAKDDGRFLVEMRPFSCIYWADVPTSLPNQVMSDEKRTFEILELMVGMAVWGTRRPWMTAEYVTIKFNNEVCLEGSQSDSSISTIHFGVRRHNFKDVMEGLSFSMCKKLVQVSYPIVLAIMFSFKLVYLAISIYR
ncbi:hypothetical protein KY290_007312 [Solanum tuberosum]|uniref:Uncharacterized protein n=1 Tax=Solanum tuberosum TaxID=4113 RepID=A0ABQ7W573_SOLTU|nr:hypothetical protein KY289_007635 [Solanum tuberosum]KAH0775901.1 hypothetical protein KY290_007312 [Solanum tuberosum]